MTGVIALLFLVVHFCVHFAFLGTVFSVACLAIVVAVLGGCFLFFPAISSRSANKQFDWRMHSFRAIAISCIVLLHVMGAFGYKDFAEALLSGSTIFFLFISGYLCQYLAIGHTVHPLLYYYKKCATVILPYLCCSLVTVLLQYFYPAQRYAVSVEQLSVSIVVKVLSRGGAQVPYWYVPFVSILFLASPAILKLKTSVLVVVFFSAFATAAIFPVRAYHIPEVGVPIGWPETFNMYTYFTWAYLLGFLYCRQRRHFALLIRTCGPIAFLWGIVVCLLIYCGGILDLEVANIHFLRSIQKLFFLIAILAGLFRLNGMCHTIIDVIARYSFPIFFIHMFYISDYVCLRDAISAMIRLDNEHVRWILDMVLMIMYCLDILLLAVCLKKVLGRFSKYTIGA